MSYKNLYHILAGIIVSLNLVGGTVCGQPAELIKDEEFRPVLLAAIDSAYNFQFEGSRKVLEPWKKQHPDHPLWTFWDGFILWWKMLPDLYSTKWDEEFFTTMEKASYEAAQVLRNNPNHIDAIIIQSAGLGYRARMYANRQEWVNAMQIGRNALYAFERVKEVDPHMKDIPFGDGLYSYYTAYIPETYPVVKTISWMFPEGNKQEGINQLKEASHTGLFTRGEALYFLANIYMNYENRPEIAIEYLQQLRHRYPRNNYYARALIHAHLQADQMLRAKMLVDRWKQEWDFQEDPLGNVMKEELFALSTKLDSRNNPEEALRSARVVDSLASRLFDGYNRPMQQMAHYYQGLILYQQERYGDSKAALQKITDAENQTQYGKEAKNLLKKIKKQQ